MTTTQFDKQTAIITGGAQGIGGAAAAHLASQGARIAIWDMDLALAEKTAAQIGNGSIACRVDVSRWSDVMEAYATTRSTFGHVYIVVNSAGIAGSNAPVMDYDVEEFQHIVMVNLIGTFHVNKVVAAWEPDGRFGRALYFSKWPVPWGDGEVFHHIGIYTYRRAALDRFVALPPSPLEKRERLEQLRALEAGMRIEVGRVETVPLGVDTPAQLEQARRLLDPARPRSPGEPSA